MAYLTRSRGPNRRATIGWDSLTPTELAVVDLVAQGLTNQAVADRLFVSGIVKTHLAHVYANGAANWGRRWRPRRPGGRPPPTETAARRRPWL